MGRSRQERPSRTGKSDITKHLWHHHGQHQAPGTVEERLQAHDDLHWEARKAAQDLGHTHDGYQDGESINDIARRMLAEGTAAQQISE